MYLSILLCVLNVIFFVNILNKNQTLKSVKTTGENLISPVIYNYYFFSEALKSIFG